jgi:hypothetical protein
LKFRDQHAPDFLDQFPDDVNQLQAITDPSHAKQHPLAAMYRQNKYIVLMSSYAFELLLSFLMDSHYVTLLKLLNQYFNIKVYSTKPAGKTSKDALTLGITGHTSQQILAVNQQQLYLGRPPPDEQFRELLSQRLKQDTEFKDVDGNDVLQQFIGAQYNAETSPPKDESLPLPPK